MYARLTALVCLLFVSFSRGLAASNSSGAELVVYLKGQSGTSSIALDEMKNELSALMLPASFRVEWRDVRNELGESDSSYLVVVELRGNCSAPPLGVDASPVEKPFPLASTAVVDGRVLPFSWVDCSALSRFLGPTIAKGRKDRRDFVYGRAMARVLAHELYHVVSQSEDHEHAGVAKPTVTANELMGEHFTFENGALAKLRLSPAPGELSGK